MLGPFCVLHFKKCGILQDVETCECVTNKHLLFEVWSYKFLAQWIGSSSVTLLAIVLGVPFLRPLTSDLGCRTSGHWDKNRFYWKGCRCILDALSTDCVMHQGANLYQTSLG